MKHVGGKLLAPTVMRCADKNKFLAKLKRLRILVYDQENDHISLSFFEECRLEINKAVDTFEKERLRELTKREAL